MAKSGKNSEVNAEEARKERLSKLALFSSTDEKKVNFVGGKTKNLQMQTQMTIMNSSVGEATFFLEAEQTTISVARCFAHSSLSTPLSELDNPYFLSMLKEQVPLKFYGSKHLMLA